MITPDFNHRMRVPVLPLLAFVMLTPLIPRPTVSGFMSALAPASLVLLITAFVLGVIPVAKVGASESRVAGRILFLLIVPTLLYGFRILIESQTSEGGYFTAKLGMSLGGLVVLLWLSAAAVDVRRVYRALTIGYVLLAVLMIYVGVTGNGLLEAARPPRSYGFHTPLFKAAGVPRSYGELAIFSSAVLAYLLVFRKEIRRPLWIVAMAGWFLTLLIAQSRTGFIAAAIVLVGFVSLRLFERRTVAFLILVGVISIPLAAQWLYPTLQSEQFVSDVIGQNIIQENVDLRVNMYATAFSWLLHPNVSLLTWGIDREQWFTGTLSSLGPDTVLHNYFLSTLMFFGIVGGSLTLLGLVFIPVWRLASSGLATPQHELVFLSTVGMLVSLQFYEGFFSLILMWQLAVLWYVGYGLPRSRAGVQPGSDADAQRPASVRARH